MDDERRRNATVPDVDIYSYAQRLARSFQYIISDGSKLLEVNIYCIAKPSFPAQARIFYDTYDSVVQDVPVPTGDAPLKRTTIRVPNGFEREYTNVFRAAERVVTYWRGFTSADRPPNTVHAKVTLQERGSGFFHFSREGPGICKFAIDVAENVATQRVSPSGSGSGSGAKQVSNPAASVVGIMIDASGGIFRSPVSRNEFVESWLRAERPAELKSNESDFLKSAGLPQCAGNADPTITNPLEFLRIVRGVTIDANARAVRVVRHAKLKTKLAYGMKQETCTATLFFVFATDAPADSTGRDVVVEHHVASVKAGFDAMIREGVSVAAIDLEMPDQSRSDIVKKALGAIVVPGSSGSSDNPATAPATYAHYIPTVAVVDFAQTSKQGFGRLEAELYTL